MLKVFNAEVMIDGEGFRQRGGTVYIRGDTKFILSGYEDYGLLL